MASFGMVSRVALVRANASGEPNAPFFRVTRIVAHFLHSTVHKHKPHLACYRRRKNLKSKVTEANREKANKQESKRQDRHRRREKYRQ
jgi:hypothetical protein